MTSRGRWRGTWATLLLTLVSGGLAACDDDGPAPDVVGTVVAGTGARVEGDSGFLFVPAGRIDVTIGRPLTRALAADETADGRVHAPPSGGAFVPVSWTHDPAALPAPLEVVGTRPALTQVALVADGTSFALGSPYDVAGVGGTTDALVRVMYVAVPSVPEQLVVSADYDGATQTLDPTTGRIGPAAAGPLYHPVPRLTASPCAIGRGEGPRQAGPAVTCSVRDVVVVPYVPGPGWAQPPQGWLVVHYRVDVGGAFVRRVSVTLDGRGPVTALSSSRARHQARAAVVFDNATRGGELRLRLAVGQPGLRRTTTVVRTVTLTR